MIRVLLVGNFLSDSGLTIGYSEQLATRLEARGVSVIITSRVATRSGRLADMVATVWRRRADYDVAHVDVFSGTAFVWAEAVCLALRLLGKPFVVTLRGGRLPGFAARWPRRVRRLLRSARVVTAPSKYLANAFSSRVDVRVVQNAVDVAEYMFRLRARPTPRMVWLRSLHQVYNPVLAVDVLARVAAKYDDAVLRMVGPDKKDGAWEAVQARARELGVEDRLTLVGGVAKSEVAAHLAGSDIFLNTTNVDNTPLSVLEAMATGLCVVTTDVGGLPYLLTSERDAILVPPRDANVMSSAVLRVLEEPGLAERLSRAGHEVAMGCDWGVVLDQWVSIFGTLARIDP